MDANEVLRRYSDGKRDFRLQDLKGLSLICVDLNRADFTGADLKASQI